MRAGSRRGFMVSSTRRSIAARRSCSRPSQRSKPTTRPLPMAGSARRRCARLKKRSPSSMAALQRCYPVGAFGRRHIAARVSRRRRPSAGHRRGLPADQAVLRRRAEAAGRDDDLLRSAGRRRYREADAEEHASHLCRVPGSQTFEVQDIPAIAKAAHDKGAVLVLDNTWATPLFFKSFAHGVDVSVQAATKYIGGHADVMLGAITASETAWPVVRRTHEDLGLCTGPEDVYLALRGLTHTQRSIGAASAHGSRARQLAERARGSRTRDLPWAPWRSGPCDLEPRLHRRFRSVRVRVEAGVPQRPWRPCSMSSNCLAWVIAGAVSKV